MKKEFKVTETMALQDTKTSNEFGVIGTGERSFLSIVFDKLTFCLTLHRGNPANVVVERLRKLADDIENTFKN